MSTYSKSLVLKMFENGRCSECGRKAEYVEDDYGVRIPYCPEHGSAFD